MAGRLSSILPGFVAAVVIAGLGFEDGGYYPTAWGPATLLFLAASAAVLVFHPRPNIGLRPLSMPLLLSLLTLLAVASSAWGSASEAVPEAERTLLYASGAFALALVLRCGAIYGVLVGLWVGAVAVCLYSLATRLFPEQLGVFDPIAVYRLSEPVGYWNALGLLATMAMLLALGLGSRAEHLLVRLLAAASTVPLALTCYFTFSRGAWLALAIGLFVALLLDPRRLQLALGLGVIAPWAAVAVLVASRSGPLTESGAHTLAAAAEDGRALAALAFGLTLFAGGAVAVVAAVEPRVRLGSLASRLGSWAVVATVVGLVLAFVLALGGPAAIARSFAAEFSGFGKDLDDRLFTLSGNGRVDLWRVAWDTASEHPVAGAGAGSYERFWLEERPYAAPVIDAHSLYLEMPAELGPAGLVLVAAMLGFPLVVALFLRRRPLVPIAAAALAAYVARAGVDWDWEFPVLTLFALGCAGVIVGEALDPPIDVARRSRLAVLAVVVALVPLVALTTLGNRAEAGSAEAFDERDFARAASEAEAAERLAPWSVEPLVLHGRAQAAAGDFRSARVTFKRAAARAPERWRIWFELAAVSTGEARAAALRRARALNPLEPRLRDLEEGR